LPDGFKKNPCKFAKEVVSVSNCSNPSLKWDASGSVVPYVTLDERGIGVLLSDSGELSRLTPSSRVMLRLPSDSP
jgi:hypothetical protein